MSGPGKYLLLTGTALFYGCASVTPPSGGPKDEEAPKVTTVVPANQSLNYGGKKVVLQFDEEVELGDLQKELIITPYTDNTYTTKVKKNTIELEFEKPLQPNTTYTFNFRNSIKDLTEGNAAAIPPITFSTGAFLDSGRVSGTVLQHLTNQPEANIDVLLYKAADTGTIKNSKPYYATRTDGSGGFTFTHLATDTYRIYALADKNNSLTYDQDNERIGYITDTIRVTSTPDTVVLRTILIDTRKPYVLKRNIKPERVDMEYNEGITEVKIQNLTQPSDSIIGYIDKAGKIVRVYRKPDQTEIKLLAFATDSAGFRGTDTVSIKYIQPFKPKKPILRVDSPLPYIQSTPIIVTSSEPIRSLANTPFTVRLDSATSTPIPLSEIKIEREGQQLSLPPLTFAEGVTQFTLLSDSSAITTITGQQATAFEQTIRIEEGSNTGSLKGTVTIASASFILQLLDHQYKVVKELPNQTRFTFNNLTPGRYRLRVLVDENQNGKWDTGNSELTVLSEPVYNYPEVLEIRANWDLEEIDFTINKPVDKL